MPTAITEHEIGERAKEYNSYFAKAQTVPANTDVDGNGGYLYTGESKDSVEVVVGVGATKIDIAITENIWIRIYGATDAAGTGAVLLHVWTAEAVAALEYAIGLELVRYAVNSTDLPYVMVNVETDDAAASGKFEAFMNGIV